MQTCKRPYYNCNRTCKEMAGATSAMPVIRGAFIQQAADIIDWTVRCDWLQVASSCIILVLHTHNIMLIGSARLVQVLQDIL